MTEQRIKEIVKTFAYGYPVEEIAKLEEMTVEKMQKFEEEHKAEIEQKKADLKEGGWLE
jgi:hypothetical protein